METETDGESERIMIDDTEVVYDDNNCMKSAYRTGYGGMGYRRLFLAYRNYAANTSLYVHVSSAKKILLLKVLERCLKTQ